MEPYWRYRIRCSTDSYSSMEVNHGSRFVGLPRHPVRRLGSHSGTRGAEEARDLTIIAAPTIVPLEAGIGPVQLRERKASLSVTPSN